MNAITPATWITLTRLLGVPVIFVGLSPFDAFHRWITLGLFLAIAATDWLDGYVARRFNQVTDLGKVLDPLVDKLLVMPPLLILLQQQMIPAWGVFVILGRELVIAGWRVNQSQIQGANLWGKAKTVVQIAAITALIAPLPEGFALPSQVLFWLAVVLTLVSGLLYLLPALRFAEKP